MGFAPGTVRLMKFYMGDNRKMRTSDLPDIPPFRFMSIDGDHSLEGTLVDLCTMAPKLADGAVLTIDDFHHPHWEHCRHAWLQYIREPSVCNKYGEVSAAHTLEPFATIGNKLWITTR